MSIFSEHTWLKDAKGALVVVAGFGGAGGAAALSAAEAGARVLVVDRAPAAVRGGNTRENLFYLAMKNTHELNDEFAQGIERVAQPWSSECGETTEMARFWSLDQEFVRTWLDESVPTVQWMEKLGFRFSYQESDLVDDGFAPGLVPDGGGNQMLDVFERKARELGVAFSYETALVGLRTDDAGAVKAVVLETAYGRETLECSSVILATGGFHGNYELTTKYLGVSARHALPLTKSAFYNRGEGFRLALELGAATAGDLSEWHGLVIDARADGERWLLSGMELGIMVNRAGERFFDESTGEAAEKAVRDQEDGVAYYIADASARRHPFADRRFKTGLDSIKAATIEELAEKIRVPVDTLRQTIFEYNAACDWSNNEQRGAASGLAVPKAFGAKPLIEMPFEAWPLRSGICFSLGGLKVDKFGRVLTEDNHAIKGLYAAGDTAGGYYKQYVNYTSSLKALVFGRRSGIHAAKSSD
ncbi:FAD-dependent oxidoreductase [Paraburkholderia tropica]|uniref:FAD-dependent oxidoreductase n=1 Tax=Paraburkholderia tropica TaxID=92647 RepID=UPI001590C5F2|nr:FAD-dependent oxidoreductase [Paraburkholderia tropica]